MKHLWICLKKKLSREDENIFKVLPCPISKPNAQNKPLLKPRQVRILIPVTRSERCLRILRLIRAYAPPIVIDFQILHCLEKRSIDRNEEIRQDISDQVKENLPQNSVKIILSNDTLANEIVRLANHETIDLVIIPHPVWRIGYYFDIRNNFWEIIRNCPVPVLFIPDQISGERSYFPIRKIVLPIANRPPSKYLASFACRLSRLLNAKTVFAISKTARKKDTHSKQLKYFQTRYFDLKFRKNCSIHILPKIKPSNLTLLCEEIDPDLLVVFNDAFSDSPFSLKGRLIHGALRYMTRPILLIQRNQKLKYLEKKFRRIFANLSDFELTRPDSIKDESGQSVEEPGSDLLLGAYSRKGLEDALRKYGVFADFKKIGYPDIHIDLNTDDRFQHRLRIFQSITNNENPLVDMVLRLREPPPELNCPGLEKNFLSIEWINLQDPHKSYSAGSIPLPGQSYPGLGFGWKVLIILKLMAERLRASGLMNCPEYYHNARLFHRYFYFSDPGKEAELMAIDRDTFPYHFGDVSWAIIHGCVHKNFDSQSKTFVWTGTPQILPLSASLKNYFDSRDYKDIVLKKLESLQFEMKTVYIEELRSQHRLYVMPGDSQN